MLDNLAVILIFRNILVEKIVDLFFINFKWFLLIILNLGVGICKKKPSKFKMETDFVKEITKIQIQTFFLCLESKIFFNIFFHFLLHFI